MKQLSQGKLITGVGVLSIVGLIFLLGGATDVSAQFRGGPQLAPEKAQAAWTLAVRGVANELGLSKEATSKLIDAYKAARENYQTTMQGMMGGGGARGSRGARQGSSRMNGANSKKPLKAF